MTSGDRSSTGEWLAPDLTAVAASLLLFGAVTLVHGRLGEILQLVVGFPFVFLVPGYALVVALFPESHHIESIERVLLAVVASLLAVTAVGVLLNLSPWRVSPRNVLLGLSAATILGVGVAAVRRPNSAEFAFATPDNPRERFGSPSLLDVAVVAAVLLAVGTVAYTSFDGREDGFTEAALLTPNDSGDLVVADTMDLENRSRSQTQVVFELENHEGSPVRYTVVVRRQPFITTESDTGQRGDSRLGAGQTVSRFSQRVGAGESWRVNDTLRPPDERVRVVYLVYRGGSPSNPSTANAYREVHLWLPDAPPENETDQPD